MKTFILNLCILLTGYTVIGQDTTRSGDTSIVYIRGLPVTGERDDSVVTKFPPDDIAPKDHLVRISSDSIPKALLKELNKGEEYEGWERSAVYYDKNTDLYILHIDKGDDVHTYRLTPNGKPVRIDVSRDQPEN